MKLFSGADSCQIQVLYVSLKSPAVQRVVLEAQTVPHMPQNQHDKLLITSGHLSVRVRPSVERRGWTIPHNTLTQPPPAVWLNGCRCLKASIHSLGLLTHALQRRMMSLPTTSTSGSAQHLTDTEQHFFSHSSSLFGSLSSVAPPPPSLFLQTCRMALRAKTVNLLSEHCVFSTETNALCLLLLWDKKGK